MDFYTYYHKQHRRFGKCVQIPCVNVPLMAFGNAGLILEIEIKLKNADIVFLQVLSMLREETYFLIK